MTEQFDWHGRTVVWERLGAGPDVVLCHGTPWSSELWRPVAERLASDYRVHLWDMPGYGRSSKAADHAVDLGVQGEVFTDLLGEWGLRRPHVVAHDFGGAVALRALTLHGASYASLALVDVVALRPWGSPFFRLVHDHADVFTQLPPAIHRGVLEAYVQGASHRGLTVGQLETLVSPWFGEEGQAAFYRQIAQADERYTEELEPLLGGLDLHVHVVWGAEDTWIPPDRAARLQGAIPGASMRLLSGAGHLVQYDAPAELGEELAAWLASQDVSGPQPSAG
jgi:pimeloyl-ACP methyl ester carboxylesterase